MRGTSVWGPLKTSDSSVTAPPIANRYISAGPISPASGFASATAAGCSGAAARPSRSRRGGTIVAFRIDASTSAGNGSFVQAHAARERKRRDDRATAADRRAVDLARLVDQAPVADQ